MTNTIQCGHHGPCVTCLVEKLAKAETRIQLLEAEMALNIEKFRKHIGREFDNVETLHERALKAEARVEELEAKLNDLDDLSHLDPRRKAVIEQFCEIMSRAYSTIDPNAHRPCDCFCRKTTGSYQNSGEALTFIEKAVSKAIADQILR